MDDDELRQLREYLDREQIRETFNRYALGVDSSDPEVVLSVFDDPCTLITEQPGKPPRRYEGRAAVERFFNRGLINDLKLLRHRITDNLIKVEGDRADARLYWDEIREQNGQLILGGELLVRFPLAGLNRVFQSAFELMIERNGRLLIQHP